MDSEKNIYQPFIDLSHCLERTTRNLSVGIKNTIKKNYQEAGGYSVVCSCSEFSRNRK